MSLRMPNSKRNYALAALQVLSVFQKYLTQYANEHPSNITVDCPEPSSTLHRTQAKQQGILYWVFARLHEKQFGRANQPNCVPALWTSNGTGKHCLNINQAGLLLQSIWIDIPKCPQTRFVYQPSPERRSDMLLSSSSDVERAISA